MQSVKLSEAQSRLPELVDSLADKGDVVITQDGLPVATLSGGSPRRSVIDLEPSSIGKILRPLSDDDDLLEEMTKR